MSTEDYFLRRDLGKAKSSFSAEEFSLVRGEIVTVENFHRLHGFPNLEKVDGAELENACLLIPADELISVDWYDTHGLRTLYILEKSGAVLTHPVIRLIELDYADPPTREFPTETILRDLGIDLDALNQMARRCEQDEGEIGEFILQTREGKWEIPEELR